MSLADRLIAALEAYPPGSPIAAPALAQKLQCSEGEILVVAEDLEKRQPGDKLLVTVTTKRPLGPEETEKRYVSLTRLPLNDEPEER
jgi:hypothetical protein